MSNPSPFREHNSEIAALRAQLAAITEQNERLKADHASEINRIHALYTCEACAEGPSTFAHIKALTAALRKAREALQIVVDRPRAYEVVRVSTLALAAIDAVIGGKGESA